jgi:hypothetical protein
MSRYSSIQGYTKGPYLGRFQRHSELAVKGVDETLDDNSKIPGPPKIVTFLLSTIILLYGVRQVMSHSQLWLKQ